MTTLKIPNPDKLGWNVAYAEATIDAPRNEIWSVLVDFARYDNWNPFTYNVDMPEFMVGEEFVFTVRMSESYHRRQSETITAIEAPHYLAWEMSNPSIFLNPVRYQVLTEIDNGHTLYQTWETFTGLLSPIIVITYLGGVKRGFTDVALALKQKMENSA